jgi:hypothetical protein
MMQVVGVTGFEPVTLRLSSACSNQLSYTPAVIPACDAAAGHRRFPGHSWQAEPKPVGLTAWEIDHQAAAGGAEEIRTPDL